MFFIHLVLCNNLDQVSFCLVLFCFACSQLCFIRAKCQYCALSVYNTNINWLIAFVCLFVCVHICMLYFIDSLWLYLPSCDIYCVVSVVTAWLSCDHYVVARIQFCFLGSYVTWCLCMCQQYGQDTRTSLFLYTVLIYVSACVYQGLFSKVLLSFIYSTMRPQTSLLRSKFMV